MQIKTEDTVRKEDGTEAKEWVEHVCFTGSEALMKQLDDPEKGWLPGDIRGTFDRWFTNYLRENVFPQYACIETATEEIAKEKPIGSAYSELESMIGLSSAKNVIRQAKNTGGFHRFFRRNVSNRAKRRKSLSSGAAGTVTEVRRDSFMAGLSERGGALSRIRDFSRRRERTERSATR